MKKEYRGSLIPIYSRSIDPKHSEKLVEFDPNNIICIKGYDYRKTDVQMFKDVNNLTHVDLETLVENYNGYLPLIIK